MGKVGLVIGILLILLSVGALIAELSNVPAINNIHASLLCNTGETYVEELGAFVSDAMGRNAGRVFSAYCVGTEGNRREITPQAFGVKAGVFAVPFVLGLLLTLGGIIGILSRMTRGIAASVMSSSGFGQPIVTTQTYRPGDPFQSSTVVTINGQQVTPGELPPEAANLIQQVFDKMQMPMTPITSGSDLTAKLRQLQEARDANLISQDEYERVRQQILDGFDGDASN